MGEIEVKPEPILTQNLSPLYTYIAAMKEKATTTPQQQQQQRYLLTPDQLDQYYTRIALPQSQRLTTAPSCPEAQLSFLQTLIKHQQIRVPFENLTLHYSWHRKLDPNPRHVFRKIVEGGGSRGGYCMEDNLLLHTVLLTLGFECFLAAGRVWEPAGEKWTGWSHLVNLVVVDGRKFLVDVGFGPSEPLVPLPLEQGVVRPQVWPAESRVVYQRLPQYLSDARVWVYQWRKDAGDEWRDMYCFTEQEVLPTDLAGMNYYPSVGWRSPFVQKVICARFTTSAEGREDRKGLPEEEAIVGEQIGGTVTLDHDRVRWRRRGKEVLSVELGSEEERVRALERFWGVEVGDEDREAILGTASAIKPKGLS